MADAQPMTLRGPTYGQDPSAAEWLTDRTDGPWGSVTSVVPTGFDAYARVLHPVDEDAATRWSTVAEQLGTRVHPLVQWHRLVGSDDPANASGGSWPDKPQVGQLAPAALGALLQVLARHTRTPDHCWFCTWEGYGWISGSPAVATLGSTDPIPPGATPRALASARVELPGRRYLLGAGPVDAAVGNGWQVTPDWFQPQSPNLFWPDDRAWFVGTEIDFDSTIVAGSRHLIDELLADPELECWPVHPTASLASDADTIN